MAKVVDGDEKKPKVQPDYLATITPPLDFNADIESQPRFWAFISTSQSTFAELFVRE